MIIDARRRRLLYRASHRGMKEMDLILGRFAEASLVAMPDEALAAFEALIEVPDQQLYDWITGKERAPAGHETAVMADLQRFCAATRGLASEAGGSTRS
jgi:antitoxin CptB